MAVPFTGTQAWITSLGYKIVDEWRPWIIHYEVAGYTQGYEKNLTFLTIKGAGHIVPEFKQEKLYIFIHVFCKDCVSKNQIQRQEEELYSFEFLKLLAADRTNLVVWSSHSAKLSCVTVLALAPSLCDRASFGTWSSHVGLCDCANVSC
ncbi:unnamed protein product [Lupinus luteus]|uniref:Serine carboxypeptidase n=1 Tax=Lupinus luteus TaxID=3873 RepID=A0AAV1Y509_LUPLU